MNYSSQTHLAAVQELQRPYRDPATLQPQDVCPRCKRKTTEHRFIIGEHPIITHHCPEHGDVIPMRSVIVCDCGQPLPAETWRTITVAKRSDEAIRYEC